jgi:SAM-dependent methyltransferase
MSLFIPRLLTVSCVMLLLGGAVSAQDNKPFEPTVGQAGKDVVWVPTAQALVDRMLDMAKVTPQDYVIDLGSGDGRTVITAAKRGARTMGIEYNPDMVALSKKNAVAAGVGEKAVFVQGDIFASDFSRATVITMFLLPDLNLRLRPILLSMKPGTRVVSNSFDMGEWQPDQEISATGQCETYCRAMLWIIPAKVEVNWKLGRGELRLVQNFQNVSGTLVGASGGGTPISEGKMNGAEISFKAGERTYKGQVNGNAMEGTISDGGTWQARRI